MEGDLVVSAPLFLFMRILAIIIIFMGNYMFLENVFQNPETTYLFVFSLPLSCIGAVMLMTTYLALNQKYLSFTTTSFTLILIATILYHINSLETTNIITEYVIYIFVTLGLLIDLACVVISESELSENRILCLVITMFLGLVVFYILFVNPYVEIIFITPEASLFKIYVGQSLFDDPKFNWTNFYISIGGLVFALIVVIGMPLYAYYKYGIKVWKPSEWGSLSWRDLVPFANRGQ